MTELDILRKNVRDLQEQLRNAHARIKILNDELFERRNKDKNIEQTYRKNEGMWAENPDALHIKDE
jgi:dynactin complex subunit